MKIGILILNLKYSGLHLRLHLHVTVEEIVRASCSEQAGTTSALLQVLLVRCGRWPFFFMVID